jgi:uncharacterized protein YndB with AHSA1/START domain
VDTRNSTAMKQDERELVITRVFDAPVELVWKCWTEGEHMRHWSAPRGFKISGQGEVRVGGAWRSCMLHEDGTVLWLGGVYREVVPNKRLVFTHAWDGADGKPGHETLVTVLFEEQGGKTKMVFRQSGFDSTGSRDGHEGGWKECLDKLGEYLATLKN